jgi:hypothetical protein
VVSDFSYRITSPWDDQRGSSLGLVDLDPMDGAPITLVLAKETPVETLSSIFLHCGDGLDVGRYFPHFVPIPPLFWFAHVLFS